MLHGAVCSEPAAAERRRLDRVEIADRVDVALSRHEDVLGVAAVLEDPGLAAVGADHLLGRLAEATLAAAPRRVDEDALAVRQLAGDLVAEHERQRRRREVALDDVEVGVAHAAGQHLDEHLPVGGLRNRALDQLERRVEGGEDDGAHGGESTAERGPDEIRPLRTAQRGRVGAASHAALECRRAGSGVAARRDDGQAGVTCCTRELLVVDDDRIEELSHTKCGGQVDRVHRLQRHGLDTHGGRLIASSSSTRRQRARTSAAVARASPPVSARAAARAPRRLPARSCRRPRQRRCTPSRLPSRSPLPPASREPTRQGTESARCSSSASEIVITGSFASIGSGNGCRGRARA